jgi:CPA2 family monovalent cation:H+ antiporter-2
MEMFSLAGDSHKLKIILLLTIGFTFASILGYFTQRIKLSPILGYLLAGFLIGPYSPGFVVDLQTSEQLAEIGVVLMMFGVGLHFKWKDLVIVKNIAVPGAIGQTLIAGFCGALLAYSFGWSIEAGLVLGMSIGVASTVVLVRVLADNNLLTKPEGHIAVGWLIVEDILTVIALLLLPILALSLNEGGVSAESIVLTLGTMLLKFFLLISVVYLFGLRVVTYILVKVARTRSHELFTLTILALTFVIAVGSTVIFGMSIALGAFIAGMVIGQTEARYQAFANSQPLKDAFVVIFFLAVGMLFNPTVVIDNFALFIGVLAIILIIKPLIAIAIVLIMKHHLKTALIVAFALAQIGEFSFILSEEAMRLNILPDEGYDIIVACAVLSIAINPMLFKARGILEHPLKKLFREPATVDILEEFSDIELQKAIVVGYGPIGQSVSQVLEQKGFVPMIIDRNVDTIRSLQKQGQRALYGDASLNQILEAADIENARVLVVTTPEIDVTLSIVKAVKHLNPEIAIFARVNYEAEMPLLVEQGVNVVCCEQEGREMLKKILLDFQG